MISKASSVREYLESLPAERRKVLQQVRSQLAKHFPKGIKEQVQYGMIGWVIPLKLYPAGYLGDALRPLPFAALAAQKNYYSLYLMFVYGDSVLEKILKDEYIKSGKKLVMGKSCIKFKSVDELDFKAIAKALKKSSVNSFINRYEKTRRK